MAVEKGYAALALALLSTAVLSACSSKTKDIEEEGLVRIYEVEKFARDIYKYFHEKWGTYIMDTISHSEQAHMDIVQEMIDKYGFDNPIKYNGYGEFTNKDLKELYKELTVQGSKSEEDALEIGAMVEEIDIVDIKKYWEQTEAADINNAYSKLTTGSHGHLRIFVSALNEKGVQYRPHYLSVQEYNESVGTVITTTVTTTSTASSSADMRVYYCQTDMCGYVYDPAVGDPDGGIAPGTPFEDIPDDWRCPVCGATKASFANYPPEH